MRSRARKTLLVAMTTLVVLAGPASANANTNASTATPTTSITRTPTSSAVSPLTPIVTARTRAVTPGRALVLVGGRPRAATSAPTAAGTAEQVRARGWTLSVGGLQPNGAPATLGAGDVLRVATGSKVTATGTGFKPGSQTYLYILDPAATLGTCFVGADGSFTCTVPVPSTLAPGRYVLQVNGYTTGLAVRSVSLGLRVTVNPTKVVKRIHTVVYFDVLSSRLDSADSATLAALVRQVPTQATKVTTQITGYVQPTSTTSKATALATARALRTASALRVNGLKGRFYVSGAGHSKVSGAKGRRVEVRVAYTTTK